MVDRPFMVRRVVGSIPYSAITELFLVQVSAPSFFIYSFSHRFTYSDNRLLIYSTD